MTKDVTIALASIIVIAGICLGLSQMRPDLPPTPSTPFSTLPVVTTAAHTNEKIVMRINGEPVTESEFNAFLQQAPEQQQAFYASPEGRHLLADQLVKLKALEQEGRRLGIENDPEPASRIEMARANILAAFTLQKIVPLPSEEKLRAEWEKQKKNFDTLQLSHILISYQGSSIPPRAGSPLSPDAAMKKAQGIEARLRAGADFGKIARVESDDVNSAAEGGRIGEVSPESLPPEVQSAVSALKDNEISQPVKSPYGIHIFKAGAHTARRYEELKPMFAANLQRQEAEATLNRLQKSAKVELDPQFFRQQAPPAPAPRGRS